MKSKVNLLSTALFLAMSVVQVYGQINIKVKDLKGFGDPVCWAGDSNTVGFLVQNTGTVVITDIEYGYTYSPLGPGGPVSQTWNGSLAPNDTITIFFPTPFVTISGPYWVQAGVSFANSQFFGDSLVLYNYGQDSAISVGYTNDFEGAVDWGGISYKTDQPIYQIEGDPTNNNWELGMPNYGVTTGTHSGTNCWDIKLNAVPDSSETSYLYTPFLDLNIPSDKILTFWQNRNTTASQDGLHIEYTTNNGSSWNVLGTLNAMNGLNWYNNILTSTGIAAWDGNSSGWVKSGFDLAIFNGFPVVQFRFVYTTNWAGGSDDGVSIDDFSISDCSNFFANLSSTSISCNGGNDGSITAVVTGGVAPYTYQWSDGNTTANLNTLFAGTYTLTVSDAGNCFRVVTATVFQPSLLDVNCSNSSTNCGQSTGMVIGNPIGGTPPYAYMWSNGQTTNQLNNLAAGVYTITVTDAGGCTATCSGVISSSNGPVLQQDSIKNPSCNGGTNGAIYISASGGTAPYTFIWSNGNTTEDITNLTANSYTVTITDFTNCSNIFSFQLSEKLPDPVISIPASPTSCTICDGIITATAFGGVFPYTYLWSNNSTAPTINNLCTGQYSCTIYDNNGCSVTASVTLQTSGFTATATSTPAGCGQFNGTTDVQVTGGYPPYVFLWSTGTTTQSNTGMNAGIYTVWITDDSSCYATSTVVVDDSCHGVWPGDANYDLTVDNNDLLNIGIAYGSTGPVRPGASLAWVAQPCPNWSANFISGANFKNADCNGDGLVDDNDTTAILLNYSMIHTFKPFPPLALPGVPDIYLVVTADSTGLSDTVNIEVNLGTGGIPVDSIYGLAFTIHADPALMDSSFANVNFNNCWMGTQGLDLLTLSKNRITEGAVDIAMVRTTHTNTSGSGPIALVSLVTTDNIAGKLLNASSKVLIFTLSNLSAITSNESYINFNEIPDSIVVDSAYFQGIKLNNRPDFRYEMAPNPAVNMTTVNYNLENNETALLEITSVTGIKILEQPLNPALHSFKINVEKTENGIYFVNLKSAKRTVCKKLVIQH